MAAREEQIILGLLNAVERDSNATQRELARELGIALGLANAYLKRCLKKGYVKVTQVPANRYLYYLTPSGFAEKTRLTADYLSQSFGFFRDARRQCDDLLGECAARGWERVALVGASELAEIMALCAASAPVTLVGVVDAAAAGGVLAGLPVAAGGDALPPHDGVVVTALVRAQAVWEAEVARSGRERVLAPPLLGITVVPPQAAG